VSASGISSSQIQISWSSASGANGYRIKRYDGSSWPVIIDNLGSGTSYSTDSGLSASTTYHYYVCAFNSGGETCNSSYVSGTTQAAPGPVAPVAPTSVAASTTSSTAIRIAWTDASSNEDGFRLRRWDGSSWAIIATLAAGSQAATDSSGLAPGSTYYYHVCSYNAGGESCAATVSATTSAGSTVSTGPTPRSPDTAPPSNGTGGPSTSSTPPPGVSDQPADGETPSPNGAVRLAAGDLPGATGTAPADNPAAAGGQPNVGGSSQPDGTVGGLTWPPMVMLLVLFPLFLLSVWVWLHSRRPGPLPANAGPLAAPLAASMAQTAIAGTLVASRGAPAVAEAGTRFELISELGRGGMGVVWKARDNETGQIVALKLLHPVFSGDPDYVTRFERELDLTQRIHSAHVVPVLGFGVHEGTPYLALAYVDGQSLRQQLADHGPYSWPEARALMAQMAEGLADAHAAGVIHRDLKPSNVLIDSDGVAKLADFGIALGLDLTRVTGTSTLLGTPAYLAPEGPEDERSDLYSLGVIGYELLTGAPPFEGKTYQAVLLAHMRTAPDLEKLPSEAQPIVGSLLEKDPAMRPQSAARLLLLLAGSATVE
jgi:hypothetical protein